MLRLGIDRITETGLIDPNLSWGLLSSDASRNSEGKLTRIALIEAGYRIERLFTPEHGLSAKGIDGAPQADGVDARTGLEVHSLYGTNYTPRLDGIDGVIFDLPDIGSRFYTYIWSLSYLMEQCAAQDKPLVILDRPNPISGLLDHAEGPMLEEHAWRSFIGRWSIPIRHSLTVAELARYWRHARAMPDLDLRYVLCEGWERGMHWADTGLPFYPPSPAICDPATLLTYPALAYLEGVNLNEGRGTDAPFQQFGAPWLNVALVEEQLDLHLPTAASWEQLEFVPQEGRYQGQHCQGLRLRIEDPLLFRPVVTGITLLAVLKLTHPKEVQAATYPTWANPSGERHLGLLLGNSSLVQNWDKDPANLLRQATAYTACPNWKKEVTPFLLY